MQVSYDDMEEILSKAFDYLVKNGIENATLRAIAQGVGYSPAHLYNFFLDKDDCIIEIAKYGLTKTASMLFEFAFEGITDLGKFFDNVLDVVEKYQPQLRTVYQVATSPVYGERMRKKAEDLQTSYAKYIQHLSEILDCKPEIITPSVFNFISIVLDYVVWNDRHVSEIQIKDLYETMTMKLEKARMETN